MRACNASSAALGMLSCKPAHAARRSDSGRIGIRSSSPPTRRRNARICRRVSLTRACTDPREPTAPVPWARRRGPAGATGRSGRASAARLSKLDFAIFEVFAHERDRHAAFADGRGDALHWAGPNIAAREDAWNARFEEVRVAVEVPSPRGRDVGTGEYVAVAIKCDLLRQPRRLRVRSDEEEQATGLEPGRLV